jgi:hypothetical protein
LSGNEKTAKILGYSGLIPFVTFSIGSWLPLPYSPYAIQIQIAYAAIILSFMGAIHWGVAMTSVDEQRSKYFIASVIPALTAWLALLMNEIPALVTLLAGFIVLIGFDWAVEKSQGLPDWYVPMRNILTFIVVLCLLGTLLSVGLH